MSTEELTDGEILERVRGGEVELFALFVRRYESPLVALAMSRLGRRELAEEAVQEAFLCAFRWLDSYDSTYAFRTWLWTILLNQCNRMGEKERRDETLRNEAAARAETATPRLPSPSEELEAAEGRMALKKAIDSLPRPQADAVRLRFFGGLKFEAIAQAMGCSLRTAKYRVKEGLVQLGALLGGSAAEEPSTVSADPSVETPSPEAPYAMR